MPIKYDWANGPGVILVRFLSLSIVAALSLSTPAIAQTTAVPAAAAVPDESAAATLLWSTMAAVDHANRTGNYSVLRDLGTPSFRAAHSTNSLAQTFAQMRSERVDLSRVLTLFPLYEFPPAIVDGGLLRMRGSFRMRPKSVDFDLLFRWNDGWALQAIAVQPRPS